MKHFRYDRIDGRAATNLVRKYYENKVKNRRSRMDKVVSNAFDIIESTASPHIMWKKFPIIPVKDGCAIQNEAHRVASRKFSRILLGCDKAVLCAATLGRDLDEELKRDDLRMYERVILDQVASDVMEAVMELGQVKIQGACKPGKSLTKRYSPGYCDWSVEGQQMLFSLLPSQVLGIKLSSSNLMSPRKSVTALLGIGGEEEIEEKGNACTRCSRRNCEFRRDDSFTFVRGGYRREHTYPSV